MLAPPTQTEDYCAGMTSSRKGKNNYTCVHAQQQSNFPLKTPRSLMLSINATVSKQYLLALKASVTCSWSLFEHTQGALLHFLQETL